MDENQMNQNNLNQQPVQPAQQPQQAQSQQAQQEQQQITQQAQQEQQQVLQQAQPQEQQQVQSQPQQPEQAGQAGQANASMQIQQLLIQQQQYQQQYNQLVDYVKKTPNLPLEQVNQIKQQLDQLNALFVQWKQQLQALWYNQVQVNKPTEVKKWSVTNFSLKKVAIWCWIILLLIFAWFFVTLTSLIKNPNALVWINVSASDAKMLLSVFTWLLFWSVIILMLWVIISNIYKLITVKNQSKKKFIRGLLWWVLWAGAMWGLIWVVFWWIWKIEVEVKQIDYDIIQPYLVWRVETEWVDEFKRPYKNEDMVWVWTKYALIAPSQMAFSLRWNELMKLTNKELPSGYEILDIDLICGNKDNTVLKLSNEYDSNWWYKFDWTCLYSEKWKYTYSIKITYDNVVSKEKREATYPLKSLDFTSDISISLSNSSNKLSSSNWEFILGKAPVKITVDTNQVFRDFSLNDYKVEWDLDWDFEVDRIGQVNFDYSYKLPKVYYVTFKFPDIADDVWYSFPVRVEQSDRPICEINVKRFPGTTKFQISTDFIDSSSAATISTYNYKIQNRSTKKILEELKNQNKEINYTFPEKWEYVVIMNYVTVDGKQWQCESDTIQLEKENFTVQYALLAQDSATWKFKELCNSNGSQYDNCTQINLDSVPQKYQLQIKKITPSTNNTSEAIYFEVEWDENTHALMEDNRTYEFTVPDEWSYETRIVISDQSSWIDDATKVIKFTAKKPDIVGILSITSSEKNPNDRKPVSEWFEPLTVILDASKTEINIPWDEIIYFTWDFWDWEIKQNQQNGVVVHTYNYDYKKETWIFTPKVTVTTLWWTTKVVSWPKLNVKKWLISVEITSLSHPSRQAQVNSNVTFATEFDWLPEKMIRDFWDWTETYTCKWRSCTEVNHTYTEAWMYSVKVSLEFDAIQQVERTMDFKVY